VSGKISIVIPTLNGGALLRECLAAIRSQHFDGEVELLAVDSGSADDTLRTLEEFGARIHKIRQPEFNHGGTRNTAIEMAEGELIVLTVQDAAPQGGGWLKALVAPFEDPKVAGVYGRQMPRADANLLTKRRLGEWLTSRGEQAVSEIADRAAYEKLPPLEKYKICNFDNVCSCIRKEVWRRHRFPETNFAEDIEWARDVLLDGCKIVFEPAAAVIHSHRRSIFYEYRRAYIASRRLHQLFGYAAVPSLYAFLHHAWYYAAKNAKMVWRSDASSAEKMRCAFRACALGFLETLAQYRAYRDEKGAKPLEKQRGV